MVNLTLGNQNQNSPYKQAIINLATGMCVVDGSQDIATTLLLDMDFSHPLLTHPVLSPNGRSYGYEYNDLDGLLDAAKYIYATLIQVDNPLDCEFKITPSNDFVRLKTQYKIPFSIDCNKKARELINIEQLNSMISRFTGANFYYQDTIVLDQRITLKDLPPAIDGDLICQTNPDIVQFCKQADAVHKCEVRYINHAIGLGVFAREDIRRGEKIVQYCGLKKSEQGIKNYSFNHDSDAFNFIIDAMHYGNIARFINHAPDNINDLGTRPSGDLLESNIIPDIHGLYGNDVVIFTASKDILKGEQLLVDYGADYFGGYDNACSIKRNGHFVRPNNKPIKESRQQRQYALRLMSTCGIKQAQWQLVRKPLIILTVTLLSAFFLTRS